MNILQDRKFDKKSAVVIGKFDGVHKGHQHLLSLNAEVSRHKGLIPLAYTFSAGGECITEDESKAQLLAEHGIEQIYFQRLSEDFKSTVPEEFVDILKSKLSAEHVTIGFNFRFGKSRCGSAEDMAELCRRAGIGVTVAEPVLYQGEPISSSRIRTQIQKGNMQAAFDMTGRHFSVTAPVIEGKRLGREIGFPTANLETEGIALLPAEGVYAAGAKTHSGTFPAIINIGTNPTVDRDSKIKAEVHIIGFDGDLYGKAVTVAFFKRLRDERTFDGLEGLKCQLEKDRRVAEEIFEQLTSAEKRLK